MESPAADIAPAVPPSDTPPDWGAIAHEILCPLCDYNLRGLIEPRCPECGHRFEWQRLLDTRAHEHPYLFEHHPRHNLRSFIRTFTASMLPRRFWRTLQPLHTLNLRRLRIYWIVTSGMLLIAVLPVLAVRVYQSYWFQRSAGLMLNRSATGSVTVTGFMPRSTVSPQPWLLLRRLLFDAHSWGRSAIMPAVASFLLWPWLTFLALLIYRASMREARIRPGHVLRCVIYTCDAAAPAMAPLLVLLANRDDPYRFVMGSFGYPIDKAIIELGLAMLLLLTYRLSVAYRNYLRFPRGVAAVIASQVIVGLVLFKSYLAWNGM